MADSNEKFEVDAKALVIAVKRLDDLKDTIGEAAGDLRSELKHILEVGGYNKKAMQIIRDLDYMSSTKLADVLRTLVPMMAAMRAEKWDAEIKDMLDELE
jgi:hypothetical protein